MSINMASQEKFFERSIAKFRPFYNLSAVTVKNQMLQKMPPAAYLARFSSPNFWKFLRGCNQKKTNH